MEQNAQFVSWFRHASPYIHAHHSHTFVISFDGAAVEDPNFVHLVQDAALLNNLGIRVVLVHGTRYQIQSTMTAKNLPWRYADGIRVTDDIALEIAKSACGKIAARMQGLLCMGLANVPQIDPMLRDEAAAIRLVTGNFITAKPVGVRNGIDFQHTGEVRRVDTRAIQHHLDSGQMVLIPPLGYSPSGEIFNLAAEDVATSVAIGLKANKWICLSENNGLRDHNDLQVRQMTVQEAQHMLANASEENTLSELRNAVRACSNGVKRVHIVERQIDGGLLLELFSRDGIGTLISTDPYENLRPATVDDVNGIIRLIEPLEQAGILVRRSREKLETEISYFVVQERDGIIIACASLYPFPEEEIGELACVVVHENYHKQQRGDALLSYMEREAKRMGLGKLYVLTTRTAHWFIERGFKPADISDLPMTKQTLYNYQRQSKVFIKPL
jgi:amino-acid N-acetyltransferase